ncbi:hypothetical protein RYX56_15745 [Alkalihalophilus lindianensis]|jgi:hypothetical protein|uniref:Uncharacterized protein n=1 Tax=Alkalihalophilus lindianensis TaxID=1630542 RepID=A0ABU3XD62_9BACI|nr:hypothetical protein [Alkalihalophilus lindianensis]MDV2685819.1 hypothetical protein [Alkalihalophilus lindianensis]
MTKRNKQQNKALTNNQTPTESMFNQEVASEMIDNGSNKANEKKKK